MPNTLTKDQIISATYVALFTRAPDQKGLNEWRLEAADKTGMALAIDMAVKFAAHPAFTTLYGGMGDAAFIDAIYVNIGGKVADAQGRTAWLNKLTDATHPITRAELVGEFIYGVLSITQDEINALDITAQEKTDAIARQDQLNNKATVALEFTAAMGVGSNLAAGTDGMSLESLAKDPAYVASQAIISGVTADDATMTAPTTYLQGTPTLNGIITDFGNGQQTGGKTFMLTTGIDSGAAFTGGAGNDVFNAALDAGAMTFTSLDALDGGAGKDTLNLVATGSLALAAGATVKNIEVVNLTSAAAITAADVTGFTGLETLNVTSGGNIAGVVAAATTDVNVANGLAGVAIDGGKNVTVTNGTAGNIAVGATTAAAGDVTATNNFATGTVGVKGAGALSATSKDGAMVFTNGTSVAANTVDAIAQATRTEHLATQTAATAANTAATTDADASGLAKVAAAAKVTALSTTLKAAIATATNVSADQTTALSIGKFTKAALDAGAITLADKVAIDAAFAGALSTSTAAARTAAQAVLTPLETAAATAKATADAADVINDANALAAKTAADAVVTADGVKNALVNDTTVVATTNTTLASATIKGNYGTATTQVGTGTAFQNAVNDGSTAKNVLTTVTLENTGHSELTGNALTNVSAKGMLGNVTVTNATVDHTQNFTLEGVTGGTYADGAAKTVNIVSNGTATNVLTGLTAGVATAVNLTGAAGLNFGTTTFAAAAVIDATGSSGTNTITVAAGQTYTGGSGADVVTTNGGALQTKTVDGGAGTADRLNLANAADFATTGAAKFLNFEILSLASGLTADASKFTGSTFTSAILNGGSASLTGLNATQAANLTATANGTYTIGVTGATTVGQLDTVNLVVSDGLAAVNTIALTTPVLAGIETLNLTATDNVTINALTSATALTNVNVTGAGTVGITSSTLALNVNSVIDASAVNSAVSLDFSAATANGISLKAGNGNNTLKGTDIAGKGNAISSGNGNSTLTGGQADDVITAGNGNNTIDAKAGANTITVGDGNNTIDVTGSVGVNTITAGNGINVIIGGAGADVIKVGTGYNHIAGGAGGDTIIFGAHAAGVVNGIVMQAAADTWTGAAIVSGTTVLTGVDMVTGLHAGDTINIAALSATFTGAAGTTIASAATTTTALVRGNFDAVTSIWTTSATGTDTLFVYDADAAAGGLGLESIVLVGTLATGSVDAGILTLA